MMRFTLGISIVFWLSLSTAGRGYSQEDAVGAANGSQQAPPATPSTQTAPTGQTTPESTPSPAVNPQTPPSAAAGPQSAAKKKPADKLSSSAPVKRRRRTARTPADGPKKIVVREGGATEPDSQIAPGMTPEEATRERVNAEKWIGSTEDQLKQLAGRTLDARQQETVGQIHNYMDGARSALKEGDVGRANTLAQKAHLLSEDLLKH